MSPQLFPVSNMSNCAHKSVKVWIANIQTVIKDSTKNSIVQSYNNCMGNFIMYYFPVTG